jgi:acetyl-CoA carboxylase biotin carboxylase subunit
VTEEVTGIDIVQAQIRVAGGAPLGLRQDDVRPLGHALECRINAEDPERGFAPCPGVVDELRWPEGAGIRVDSHLYAGYRIPPYYDSLLAKVIARGENRTEAIARMRRALSELELTGVPTTVGFHARLLGDERFVRGEVHTRFIEDEFAIQP